MTTSDSPRRRGRPPGATVAELLDVARTTFLERGFAGTTMEAVAVAAGVSKSSLYQVYPSKDELLRAVVADWVDRGQDAMRPHVQALLSGPEIHAALLTFVRTLQASILSADVLGMRRLIASEASRCPAVAALYLENSWRRNLAMLTEVMAELNRRGSLLAPDPASAAEQLVWLAVGAALNDSDLSGAIHPVEAERLELVAVAAVETFSSRYVPQSLTTSNRPRQP